MYHCESVLLTLCVLGYLKESMYTLHYYSVIFENNVDHLKENIDY